MISWVSGGLGISHVWYHHLQSETPDSSFPASLILLLQLRQPTAYQPGKSRQCAFSGDSFHFPKFPLLARGFSHGAFDVSTWVPSMPVILGLLSQRDLGFYRKFFLLLLRSHDFCPWVHLYLLNPPFITYLCNFSTVRDLAVLLGLGCRSQRELFCVYVHWGDCSLSLSCMCIWVTVAS